MYQIPSLVVTLVWMIPVPVLVTVICAPGITAPDESLTAPSMVAVPVLCAKALESAYREHKATTHGRNIYRSPFVSVGSDISWKSLSASSGE